MGWLLGILIAGAVISLGWVFVTEILPKMVGRRVAPQPDQHLTTLPGVEPQPVLEVDAETSIETSKRTHDAFVSEAADLVLQSRGAGLFAADLLAQADEKVGDAIKLRPGSFDANLLAGEIGVKRALLAEAPDAVGLLEEAAVRFATAIETKKGVIDGYVGRGWAHLELAYQLGGDPAAAAYLDAAAVFHDGYRVNPHNLFILKGWGLAIDGVARAAGADLAAVRAAEDEYRLALAEHRGGDHELHAWYAAARAADQAPRMPMPGLRDRY